ncbi:MAG: hypothetical protein P3X22_000925 [Thermoprotei archaeon]|nr:hypothetical protein [Thermoprotei archaeon]
MKAASHEPLEAETENIQSKNVKALYILVPVPRYLFKADERIRLAVELNNKMMVITSSEEPSSAVSFRSTCIRRGVMGGEAFL